MTITLTREEAQQVLDALQAEHSAIYGTSQTVKATELLRTRLAQSEPEQLGKIVPADEEQLKRIAKLVAPEPEPAKLLLIPALMEQAGWVPKREWQGLTEMEIMDICNFAKGQNGFFLVREVEAKLKEKNNAN